MKRFMVFCGIVLLAFLGSAKLYDRHLETTRPMVSVGPYRENPEVWSRTLYPYSGYHLGENTHFEGPIPGTTVKTSVATGDHGFFVDIDLDHPPAKRPGELRVLLTGGSAAQGWGASTNDPMLYRALERTLNRRLQNAELKHTVRLINLAMYDHLAYQNARVLNLWGHALAPDLILSVSGAEDMLISQFMRSNAWRDIFVFNQRIVATRPSDDPMWLRRLRRLFPGLLDRSELGFILRDWAISNPVKARRYYENARRRYTVSHNIAGLFSRLDHYQAARGSDAPETVSATDFIGSKRFVGVFMPKYGDRPDSVFSRVTVPAYVHALKSIKRDFCRVPIVVAFQPIDWRTAQPFMGVEYDVFRSKVQSDLDSYLRKDWLFVDLQAFWVKELMRENDPLPLGSLLSDRDQAALATFLTDRLAPVLETLVRRPARDRRDTACPVL